jgi:hypothetical protein
MTHDLHIPQADLHLSRFDRFPRRTQVVESKFRRHESFFGTINHSLDGAEESSKLRSGMGSGKSSTARSTTTSIVFHQILLQDPSKYRAWIDSWHSIAFDRRAVYGDDDLEGGIRS